MESICQNNAENAIILAKYADTLLNNRRLYRYYLKNRASTRRMYSNLLNDDLFFEWTAVKNGIYKIAAGDNIATVAHEICEHLNAVFENKIHAAKKIIELSKTDMDDI